MRTDIPQSGTIVWKEEPLSLHQMFQNQDMVIVQQYDTNILAAYDLDNRYVYIQDVTTYHTEQSNLLWLKENAPTLYANWWFFRDQKDQQIKRVQSKDTVNSSLILPDHLRKN